MLNLYIYLILQLLVVFLIYYGFTFIKRYAPPKIRILSVSVFALLITREISLLILFLWENIMYLHLLKPFVFLNLVAVPLAALICLYILARNDKVNFSYSFVVAAILLITYILFINKIPQVVQSSERFGYYISMLKPLPAAFFYIGFNTLVIIIAILQVGKPTVNSLGLYIIILAALMTVGETILSLLGIELLVHSIIGDVCWILSLNYSILRLKSK
jgi:hypothetical protein